MDEESEGAAFAHFMRMARGFAAIGMNIAFLVAGLAALYLLYGIFSGNFAQATAQDWTRLKGVISACQQAMVWGMGIGSICLAIVWFGEEWIGYALAGGAVFFAFGLPWVHSTLGGVIQGQAMQSGFAAFLTASIVPGIIGSALIVYDVVRRFATAFKPREVNPDDMEYGTDAAKEKRLRLSPLAKCWEGPFCRESIRPHCPIFIKRAACWKERRGCYCEEDIVVEAAAKVQGVFLEMAPSTGFNFTSAPVSPVVPPPVIGLGKMGEPPPIGGSSPVGAGGSVGGASVGAAWEVKASPARPVRIELTPAEKRERCRNCVIFNEHEEEKYRFLLPGVILGSIVLVLLLAYPLRGGVDLAFTAVDAFTTRVAYTSNSAPKLSHPPDVVAWGVVGAVGLMFVSKMLHVLEWACFKIKI